MPTLRRRERPATFGKETQGDGTWKLELYPLENPNAFQKWGVQRYKLTPLGWIEMGDEDRFFDRNMARAIAFREGYVEVI